MPRPSSVRTLRSRDVSPESGWSAESFAKTWAEPSRLAQTHALQDPEPVAPRHRQVEDQDVRPVLRADKQCLFAIGGFADELQIGS